MPTYQYACTACDHRFEAVQAFTDDSLTTCPVCGGQLRKVYGSVGVVFKGSGFYRTDSRNGKSTTTAAAGSDGKSETKSDSKSEKPATKSESPSSSGGDSKPAAASTGSSSSSGTKAAG